MDILANIEAASIAGNHLKQYMAAASRLAGLNSSAAADGSQQPSPNLAEIGAALQALISKSMIFGLFIISFLIR